MPRQTTPNTTYQQLLTRWFTNDTAFDRLYPISSQLLSQRHWTPLNVAKVAAGFLASPKGARILDIGSGIGKFCLAGAHFNRHVSFYGIEQRENFVEEAEHAKKILGLQNVHFLKGNFSKLDFSQFNHFYFFNSFYENLTGKEKLDNSLSFSDSIFFEYSCLLFQKLAKTPKGTRLVTYHGLTQQIPTQFRLAEEYVSGFLECWIKE